MMKNPSMGIYGWTRKNHNRRFQHKLATEIDEPYRHLRQKLNAKGKSPEITELYS